MLKNKLKRVISGETHQVYVRVRLMAVLTVRDAVRKGELPNLRTTEVSCVDCGRRATGYDHRDYLEPLLVDPLCGRCNVMRGPAVTTLRRLGVTKRDVAVILNHNSGDDVREKMPWRKKKERRLP